MQDHFVAMLSILNDKIQEQQATISTQTDAIYHLGIDKENLSDDLSEREHTLRMLRGSLDSTTETNNRLQREVFNLKEELRVFLSNDPLVISKAQAFMAEKGEALLKDGGQKITCIKHVREVTGWGLKESKDYVEAYADDKGLPGGVWRQASA